MPLMTNKQKRNLFCAIQLRKTYGKYGNRLMTVSEVNVHLEKILREWLYG